MRVVSLLAIVLMFVAASVPAKVIVFDANQGQGGLHVERATQSFVEVEYRLEFVNIEDLDIGGSIMQQVSIPGVFIPNDEGAPNVPRLGRYVAKPNGSTASVEVLSVKTELLEGIDLAPAPNIPLETDDSPLVYRKDPSIYTMDAYYPQEPILVGEPTVIRGVETVTLGITPFQYNPVTRELLVYTDVKVRVNFSGGTGSFGEDRLRSRYWEPILEQHLVNYSSLPAVDFNRIRTRADEYDYVIICPDDATYTTWADSLAKFRTLQGIDTGVFTLTQTGATYSAIESWVNTAYNTWDPAPSAVLLLGDYVSNGGTTGITSPYWNSYCVSDNIYADVTGSNLPDIAFARMTATTSNVENLVMKAINYERHPVTDPGFYDHPISAGGWQTERWFILCCEVIYGYWANVLGKSPVREYAIYSGTPGSVWSTNSNTWMIVNYFGPTGLGYIPATPAHLTDWGGNATRLNNDIHDGAFVLQHRDHGSETFWGEPYYSTGHISMLTNDELTFVFSINCLTGRYDWGGQCFTEAFHRSNYGALGVVAASHISYSFVNDVFTWGMYDGMWPDFMPDYPYYGPVPTNGGYYLRPAFGHASGKYFLQQSTWPSNPSQKTRTHHLFHMHGDAYTTLYSEVPQYLTVSHDSTIPEGSTSFDVTADDGSVIGLSVDGELIGVADGTGSPVTIAIDPPPTSPGEMLVTVTMQNHYRYSENVDIVAGWNIDPDLSSVTVSQALRLLFCPGGDADNIVITVTVRDDTGQPIQGIPAGEIEITVNNSAVAYNFDFVCEASRSLLSTQPTDANGQVFIPLERAGGYDPAAELETEVVNVVLTARPDLEAKSPDFDASGAVNLVDFAYFASCYGLGAWPADLDYSGTVNLVDFAIFAAHYGHNCGSDRTLPIPPDALAEFEAMVRGMNGGEFPQTYALYQNAPNPFNPVTVIEYDVPAGGVHVKIEVFDVSGRLVTALVDGMCDAGRSAVVWDGTNGHGEKVSSGIYYCRMEAEGFDALTKMVMLK